MIKIISLLFFVWIFGGCVARPLDEPFESEYLQIPEERNLQSMSSNDLPLSDQTREELEEDRVILFQAPDQTGKNRKDFVTTALATKEITIEVVGLREDDKNRFADIKFINATATGVTTSLSLYAYDSDGRILRTISESIFIRQGSDLIRQFVFSKESQETRWIFSLTGK